MVHIKAADAVRFEIEDVRFLGLAAPSRGARETAVWQVSLAPGAQGTSHRLSREEVLVALSGQARAQIGGQTHSVQAGDAIVVPPETEFSLSNDGAAPFVAVAVLPVGAKAQIGDGAAFVPPWAQ